MILSMTGYGEVQHSLDGVSYVLEVKSLNSRYFKAAIKLPEHLALFEPEVEKMIRDRRSRGSIVYSLRVRDNSAAAAQEINRAALESYLAQIGPAAKDERVRVDLAALLALPGVCQPPDLSESMRQQQWTILEQITQKALDKVIEMRRVEGRSICEDLLDQCRQIRQHLSSIQQRSPGVLKEYHQRLVQRANELIQEAKLQLHADDLRREIALYAERSDINEEISRLGSHLDQFGKICTGDGRQAGRKLDFLAQEMLREANTIASKANDASIAHHVVEVKGAIDRLKEQVQNVE